MDILAVGLGHNPNRAVRKPLHDTTTAANNFSSPNSTCHYPKPQCLDPTQYVKTRRYDHTTEKTHSGNLRSKVVSLEAGEHRQPRCPASVETPVVSTPKPSKLRTGKARVGPWILGRTLGKGSSGRVRLAKHVETGQLAAIKIVEKGQPESSSPYDARDQGKFESPLPSGLEREVVIMKLIDHPNVMGLWDVWENRGELYLVLEYIEGGELFDHLTSRGRLPEKEAMRYFRQIMSGIDYCQHFNICHRDLKPENLLLDANNNIKIADFGMAALQPQGSLLNTPCGSPHYASPEIVSGKQYDGTKSDIWSCGIVLFALLAGYLPFDHEDICELLQKVMVGRFNMPQEFSNEAQDLIWRMLTVNPKTRITIEQIWKHPLVKRHAPIDPQTGLETDRGPRPPSSVDIGRPVNNKANIDREILKNLRTLWQGVREKELVERLLSNVHNQEKVFYYLLMKYRYEHLENYPGTELVPGNSLKSQISPWHGPLDPSPTSHSKNLRATGITCCHNEHRRQKSSLVSHDDRCQTREKDHVTEPNNLVGSGRRSRPYNQPKRSRAQDRYVRDETLQRQRSKLHLRAVPSKSPLAVSAPPDNRGGGKRRSCHSKSSLVGYMSSSPSVHRSIKLSRSYKRHVSFKHRSSRNLRSGGPKLTVRNNTDHGVWVDGNRKHLDREDSPKFEQPEAALLPRGRRERACMVKRRSTVVIDGQVLHSGYAGAAQYLRKKQSFIGDNGDAERRRMVSKELEEACEKAFNSSVVRPSLATLSTATSIEHTIRESANTTSNSSFPDNTSYSLPRRRAQIASQGIYVDSLNSLQNGLPSDTSTRKRIDSRNTLRIFGGGEDDSDKGCLDDVIEYLDRLMDSSAKFHGTQKPRAVSQGGVPLKLGSTLPSSKDAPDPMKQYLDQEEEEEEKDHQKHRVLGTNFRNVSTPNPLRSLTMSPDRQNKQPVSTNAAFEPALSKAQAKGVLGEPMGNIPRNETTNTIRAANEALKFDALMPIPELRLPVASKELLSDRPSVTSDGNLDTKPVESSESVSNKVVNGPRKKRSFMDILTGRRAAKSDKKKGTPGDEDKVEFLYTFANPPTDVLGAEKGTFGRRSGNVLRRFVSRDAKKELGIESDVKKESGSGIGINIATSLMPNEGNSLVSCFSFGGYMSDEEAHHLSGNHDEFTRVMGKRSWIQKVLNVKPASRIIDFNISAFQCRREILKLYKDWLKHGLVIVEDDRKGLILRAKVGNPNSLNIKEVTFVVEIFTHSGSKKTGSSVVQFTQEKGAASSFNRVMDEITLVCTLKGLIAQDQQN